MWKRKEKSVYSSAEKLSIREKFNWFLITLVVILSVVSINIYTRINSRKIDEQREYELIKVSQNTSHYFQNFLNNKLEWIRMFAVAISMSDNVNPEDWRNLLKNEHSEDYQLGIADTSGIIRFGNNEQKDIRDQAYFQHSIKGEDYISKLNKSHLHENDSIILSVPINNLDGEIVGIVAMEYSTMKLGEYINNINSDWDEYGVNLIINRKGEIVASYKGPEKYDTFYDVLRERKLEEGVSLEEIKENITNDKSGIFHYYKNDKRRMIYYQPLDINDWTMISIGAMKYNTTTLNSIERNNIIFSVIFALIILLATIATRNIYHCRTQKIKKMKLDKLTQIYRRGVGEELVKSIFQNNKNVKIYGCIFIDVDDFKSINDTYGHEKGDEVLASLGEILLSDIGKDNIVYRYGGDEFCIWLCGNGSAEDILEIGNLILSQVSDREIIHLSLGATYVDKNETRWQDALKRADIAVYEAKNRGKNQIVLYENMINQ